MGLISVNMHFSSILSSQPILGNKPTVHHSPCLKNICDLFFVVVVVVFFPVYKNKMFILGFCYIYIHMNHSFT